MFKPFVHLHNHTDCSFLDGAVRIKDLVSAAAKYKMPAVAITDHGGLFGLIEFYKEAKKAGIKPILGVEVYVAPDSRFNRTYAKDSRKYDHLILLARNETGYHNLITLASRAYIEGFFFKPRIDKELLREHAEGLIGLSACIQGEISHQCLLGNMDRARAALHEFLAIFGKDHFYIELQNHGIEDEIKALDQLLALAKAEQVPLVATNDTHYLNREDVEAHDALLCIQTGKLVKDADRMRFTSDQLYFKTYDEMHTLFGHVPEALENSVKIAEACNVNLELDKKYFWPSAPREQGFADDDEYLAHLSHAGLAQRFPAASADETPQLKERLDFELEVMKKMKVSGYMLIVWDFIRAARNMGILVGPGRGSCVGSLVSYCIGITAVNPLKHQLLFERFLNPERVSMPDIDVDFADKDRNRVIQYVIDKYGKDCVCQIGTLGSMNAKGVLRDVARVLDIPLAEVNTLCKFIPNGPNVELDNAIAIPEVKTALESSELNRKWIRIARTLEGLKRQPGVHAAGVIIAPENVMHYSPLYIQKDTDMLVTMFDKNHVESVGLLKMDFLGLRNLTVIEEAVKQIERNHGAKIDIDGLPLDDPRTFELFAKGETVGVFQFESQGMQEYLRKLKPTNIEDIIAMNALYRPGPMENIPAYINRKHGREKINFYHPSLEQVLKDTYGIIVYQEQVMQIAQIIGGFTLGKADILRRAMGKKKPEEMAKMKAEFLAGAKANRIKEQLAVEIYELLEKFAQYGFNKSHAAAYSYVAYQTAWLKAHYPAEFMAANMTSELNDIDRVVVLMAECKRMGMKVLPPDINKSQTDFRAIGGQEIMFGLGAIKNAGMGAVEAIIAARDNIGAARTMFEFCARLDMRVVNKRVIEALIFSGAMDGLKGSRAQLFAGLESAMEFGAAAQRDRENGQTSLFDQGQGQQTAALVQEPELPDVDPWPFADMLKKEKEIIGFYVSGHPLMDFEDEIRGFTTTRLGVENLKTRRNGEKVVAGGMVTTIRRIIDKKGKPMAFVQIEDFFGPAEVLVFSSIYETAGDYVQADTAILVSGTLDLSNENSPKIIADRIMPAAEARDKLTRSVNVRLKTADITDQILERVKAIGEAHPGPYVFILHLATGAGDEYAVRSAALKVGNSKVFLFQLREIAGEGNVWLGRDA
ncbi:MAG: DNA polymerase III subunit alpha [Candidatus Raymondbacteria bacterium RifOxyA12_full_50_37]|uniref:DNA polymerase III subunit alpha n=1 Tax=Candidatus Raymondbacteria bacterium RIFOXYD12_FULL_49_13 TaxID=1817890 RepID=A0A1F7FCN3_UNCRA|nr:MAG: DNA polymerase III subunit alpha [Candidatus Raymondbacteria bacterium RifOxyA12_full_50_37]OGJ86300.1 MAG: DNA polymerase III subunit alpha [Candidatus Raymondbacteria bacterium RIFOXYA2_FULL_49_16]OGJ95838.1 MAG: DNA polymerase III subunit alpha [Candidatus Raymondbacteria bacterium RIFOXYC2_FULL_50_21]OGK04403.1 MAG: DNA polymerase III subunit alpha [Candidatus Raymondbacteria bacterium RIFOXYD12_FULL_49_13]OGP42753.1 MAG: DNA polymerase III subunit alpha [Candidatus Raymondbacteria 